MTLRIYYFFLFKLSIGLCLPHQTDFTQRLGLCLDLCSAIPICSVLHTVAA